MEREIFEDLEIDGEDSTKQAQPKFFFG